MANGPLVFANGASVPDTGVISVAATGYAGYGDSTGTVQTEFLSKLDLVDKDLAEYSRETVQLFYRDATAAAYQIKTTRVAAE